MFKFEPKLWLPLLKRSTSIIRKERDLVRSILTQSFYNEMVVDLVERWYSTISQKFDPIRVIIIVLVWSEVVITFIEGELFHDKRRNLTVYEKLMSILLARSRDGIY
jgi:hypothetical protein